MRETSTCVNCGQPIHQVDGEWRHVAAGHVACEGDGMLSEEQNAEPDPMIEFARRKEQQLLDAMRSPDA